MLKKILGVFLVVALLVPMASVVHANSLAQPLYGESLMLRNGSFSSADTGWTVSGGSGNLFKTEDGNTFFVPGEKDAKITQLVTGLTPGMVYECTFRMKSSMADAAHIGIVQKNYAEGTATDVAAAASGAPWERIVNYSFTYEKVFENWADFRFTFVVPTGGNAVSISFGANRADESLVFDDISVVRTENLINNSSLDEEVPKCIVNGIGTTELPCQWQTSWKDGFMQDGTGVDGTKGMSVLGQNKSLNQSFLLPLQGGREYTVSYNYMVKRRYDTSSEDVVTTHLANTRAYAKIECTGNTKNVGNHQALEEGVWYRGVASYKLQNALETDAVRLLLCVNTETSAELLICYDNIKVEYAKGSTTWHNHGDTAELTAFPTSGVQYLRARRMQYNHGTTDMNARLILCIYREENGIKCLESYAVSDTKTITPGNRVLGTDFWVLTELPTMKSGVTYYAEAFVWDSLEGLTSLSPKSVLR